MKNKTLIILPGWGGNCQTWQEFTKIAQEEYNVHCIDLPCFGEQPCPKTVWGVEKYAKFVERKIKKIRTPNSELILLGHSFGGQVAAYLAASNPDLINKLILSGAAIFRPQKSIKRISFLIIAKIGKIIFKLPLLKKFGEKFRKILYKATNSPDYLETSGIKRKIFRKITREDFRYLLPHLKIPTLVVWGKKDTYIPVSDGKKIAKLIPNSELHIFPDGKHGLHLQQPEKLYEIINKFIIP